MSSASDRIIVSTAIVAAVIVGLAFSRHRSVPAGPVHLSVAPVEEASYPAPAADRLRVCADPNNLPFSDDRGQGFENALAEMVARDLGKTAAYYWQPQRRGFVRTTLNAGACDVVMGVPSSLEMVRTTRPYYRSSFVFASRADRHLSIRSLDDPQLRRLQIGIQIVGDDYENPPAAEALAARHIFDNVHGYTVYGNYSRPHPSLGVLDALRDRDIDVAIVWGPLAGYFSRQGGNDLAMVPVPRTSRKLERFAFDISMGVKRGNIALASALDEVIKRRHDEIAQLLTRYGVPVVATDSAVPQSAAIDSAANDDAEEKR